MWQIDGEVLREVISLISDAVSGSSNDRQYQIAARISELALNPQFPCYLLSILTDRSLSLTLRLASGHTLKSMLEKHHSMPSEILLFLQQNLLNHLLDDSISAAISNIACTLYITQEGWPDLLRFLSDNITNNISLSILAILFEDISTYSALCYLLNSPSYSEIIGKLSIQLLDLANSNSIISFKVLNQLSKIMPTAFMPLISKYLDVLISSPFNEYVAEGIFTLSCSRKDMVKKYFKQCAEIMLNYMISDKGAISCNFWMEFINEKAIIQPYLNQLLFIVLQNLKLTDNDIMMMMPDNEEFRFDKEETEKNWSKRRESAILLDNLGTTFGEPSFLILQNDIQALLVSPDWVAVESGLLALGALAPGASSAILPSLGSFLPFLLQQTQHTEKLVIAMALWTISRFTDFIIGTTAFKTYLETIIVSMRNTENIVQQAACTAFCILISRNPEELYTYLDSVLQIFSHCLMHYKGKALINLLDAISSVSDVLSSSLNEEKYVGLLFEPVYSLWTRTKTEDRLMWTLCECLGSIIYALGKHVESYLPSLLQRCCEMISYGLASNEKQFAVKGLELSGVLIEHCSSLNSAQLLPLISMALEEKDIAVKQYAAATVGDLIFNQTPGIESYLTEMIPKLYRCLCVVEGPDDISSLFSLACNNSACALSEIAVNYPSFLAPYIKDLIKIVTDCAHKTHLPQVKANLMCTIGKFGLVSASDLAQSLNSVLYLWCDLMTTSVNTNDKCLSFLGMTKALLLNIKALDKTFQYFVGCLVSYKEMPLEVKRSVTELLLLVKSVVGESWEAYVGQMPFRKDLLDNFQV